MFKPHSEKQNSVLFSDKRITIAGTGIQWGKGVTLTTIIKTLGGYKPASKIDIGDTLFDINGDKTKVIGVYPQPKQQIYKIRLENGLSFKCDSQHLHYVYLGNHSHSVIPTTLLYELENHYFIEYPMSNGDRVELRSVDKLKEHDYTVCFEVDSPTKTFTLANGIVTHNTSVGVIRLKMAMHTYTDPLDNFLVCSPTYKILNQSTLPPFLALNKGIGTYNKKDDTFKIKGGGTVYFRSGKDPDAVVGITNVRSILCDEAGKYTRYFWDNIQARSSFKQAPITIVTSPYSLNWLYKDFIRPYQKGDEYIKSICHLVQAASKDNPYFPQDEYELRRRTMEPRRFNMIYGGTFEKADGLVYANFDADTMVVDPFEFPSGTEFYGGIDWGFTHPAVILIRAVLPSGLHVEVAEFHKTGQTINDLARICQGFNSIYPVKRYMCDPAEPDSIMELCRQGVKAVAANNSIRIGIDNHYELISSGNYKVLRNACPHLIDEYEQYHYPELKDLMPDQDEKDELPVDQYNHCADVARYISWECYKPAHRHNKIVVNGNELYHTSKPKGFDPTKLSRKSNHFFKSL